MMRLANEAAEVYYAQGRITLDLDVILLGILLHDAGKLAELPSTPGAGWTPVGHLVGHVTLCARIWHALCDEVGGVPADLRLAVEHVILSHHGELAHGSPVTPRTPEAILVSALDSLDSRLAICWGAIDAGESSWKLGGEVYGEVPAVDPLAVAASPPEGLRIAPAPEVSE
jgi:23S rRNA maturation-related 3'-5' exoribonuclease YhaM